VLLEFAAAECGAQVFGHVFARPLTVAFIIHTVRKWLG
jgi:hypothetical protein